MCNPARLQIRLDGGIKVQAIHFPQSCWATNSSTCQIRNVGSCQVRFEYGILLLLIFFFFNQQSFLKTPLSLQVSLLNTECSGMCKGKSATPPHTGLSSQSPFSKALCPYVV